MSFVMYAPRLSSFSSRSKNYVQSRYVAVLSNTVQLSFRLNFGHLQRWRQAIAACRLCQDCLLIGRQANSCFNDREHQNSERP